MNKVAKVTIFFWIMKICATTLGETAADQFSQTMKWGYAVPSALLLSFFFITLGVQLWNSAFNPFIYWLVIVSTSTAGTAMSDFMDRTLGWGYTKGSLVLVSCLAAVLLIWRLTEGTLSVDNIKTRRAELFYWFAILFSNTLGTALGDFTSDDLNLGFMRSAALYGGAIALTALAFYLNRSNRVLWFWIAFILTRPFGAAFGDVFTKSHEKGGLGLGTLLPSLVLAGLLFGFLVFTTARDKRLPAPS